MPRIVGCNKRSALHRCSFKPREIGAIRANALLHPTSAPLRPSFMNTKPPMLTGYRVLDITQFVAGPTSTRILAELGADVIKVELAPHGDRSRAQGIKPRGSAGRSGGSTQSTYFFQHNHSKRSIALAWKHPRAPG